MIKYLFIVTLSVSSLPLYGMISMRKTIVKTIHTPYLTQAMRQSLHNAQAQIRLHEQKAHNVRITKLQEEYENSIKNEAEWQQYKKNRNKALGTIIGTGAVLCAGFAAGMAHRYHLATHYGIAW